MRVDVPLINFSEPEEASAMADSSHQLLDLCLRFGTMLMEVGAETSRVEDSITRILKAYGLREPSAFAIPTLVLITFKDEKGSTYTSSRRITVRGNNLYRLTMLNQLSRTLCEGERKTTDYFRVELEKIAVTPNRRFSVVLLATVLVSLGFTLIFRGSWLDALASCVTAVLMRLVFVTLERMQVNSIFNHLVSAFVAGLGIEGLYHLGLAINPALATIAVIMNIVPGMLITNSIRETIGGDFTSGMNKIIEALLIAVALAVGAGSAVVLFGR